jgi:hypothetical protein
MNIFVNALWLGVLYATVANSAFGFPTQHDTSPGTRALRYDKRKVVWGRVDFSGVDGAIKTSPPDAIKYDRTMEAFCEVGAEVPVAPNLSVRGNLGAMWERRKEEEKDPPKSPIDRSYTTAEPSVDVTYTNPQGLEIFGGIGLSMQSSYVEKQVSETTSSDTTFGSVSLFVPRFGMVRRGATWNGGFYYVMGRDSTRTYRKVASDETETSGTSPVYIPSVIGIVGQIKLAVIDTELDLAQVRAGGGGEKSESGVTIRDDYLRFDISGLLDLGGSGLRARIIHNTLSYSNSAFMNIDSIPISSFHFDYIIGAKEANVYYGLIYGYAHDGQSIPEFNADYKVNALAISTGLILPI